MHVNDGLVPVYSKTTGRKHRIPAHWVDHPRLGRNFRKTPLAASQDDTTPSIAWKADQLRDHAREHDIDLAGATTKAEMVAAIEAHEADTSTPQDPDGTPPPVESPATGQNQE